MDTKPDDMYMENLDEWIFDENKVVTYKYLSRSLKCHVNVAKQMLFNFLTEQKKKDSSSLGVVYLVSGFCKIGENTSGMKVCLVKEQDMETVCGKFSTITSKHIYSLQKSREISATALYATDLEVFKEDKFAGSSLTAVKNKLAVPRAVEERKAVAAVPKPVVKKEKVVEAKKEDTNNKAGLKEVKGKAGIQAAFAKATSGPKKVETVTGGKKKAEPAKKTGGGIANMFAKQTAKSVEKKKAGEEKQGGSGEKEEVAVADKTEPREEKLSPDTSPGKENIVNQKLEEDATVKKKEVKDEPKQQQKPGAKKASAAKNKKADASKKRKRIQVMSDSEDEEDNANDADDGDDEPKVEEEAPPQAALIQSDDDDDDEMIPATPQQKDEGRRAKNGRRKVKKMVDKTFMDDKGFMVTKKVYESGSETDNEPSPVKNPPKPAQTKVSPPAAKKQKVMAPGGNKQQGIMNFFKKK